MRILLVEDDQALGEGIRTALKPEGYTVDWLQDGASALHALSHESFELAILDLGLPRMDGLQVLKHLRAAANPVPVLVLTARDATGDRIAGLDAGADDYLVKPFAFSEFLARVQALLRRGRSQEPTVLRLADLELDLARRRAQRAGRRLDLTAKEFNLLALLLRRQGQVLSRTTLAEQVWDMNFDSDTNVIDVAVRRLRGKLDDPYDTKLLHTVRGMGYVLESRPADGRPA